MRKVIIHLINIIFYWPLVIVMFVYLIFHPNQMTNFMYGLEAITNYLGIHTETPKK